MENIMVVRATGYRIAGPKLTKSIAGTGYASW
jgi:hypothetical protein